MIKRFLRGVRYWWCYLVHINDWYRHDVAGPNTDVYLCMKCGTFFECRYD